MPIRGERSAAEGGSQLAFGIEPGRVPYRLRLARYPALAESVARHLAARAPDASRPRILDLGGDDGRAFRYIDAFAGRNYEGHLVDLFPKGTARVHRREALTLHRADLEAGLDFLPSGGFDVAICEQVLEHLNRPEAVLAEMHRVLVPGGLAVVGVPIFPPGLAWLRRHVVPRLDRLRGRGPRSHVQGFSLASVRELVRGSGDWTLLDVRGFRIVSGGILRALEHRRRWWRLNRRVGRAFPALCIEVQLVARRGDRSCAVSAREPAGPVAGADSPRASRAPRMSPVADG